MTDIEKIICITCPKGCTLEVTKEGNTIVDVKSGCKRGHEYAHNEIDDPRRMVASTVMVEGGLHPLLPVFTSAAFPKPRIPELLGELRKIRVKAPIRMEDVVLENALGTGINILASRDVVPAGKH